MKIEAVNRNQAQNSEKLQFKYKQRAGTAKKERVAAKILDTDSEFKRLQNESSKERSQTLKLTKSQSKTERMKNYAKTLKPKNFNDWKKIHELKALDAEIKKVKENEKLNLDREPISFR